MWSLPGRPVTSLALVAALMNTAQAMDAQNALEKDDPEAVLPLQQKNNQKKTPKTNTLPALDQEEVVVTGTRTEQTLIDSPVKVEVISQQVIERQHARDLAEALKTAPGVQLHEVRGKQGQEVWLQGIGADRVLVLIDSEPVAASTGSAVDVTQISAADVQRVEIVKGATSVLYGSSAMGGVVNVITAQPGPGLSGKLAVDVGSYGGQNPSGNDWQTPRQRVNAQLNYADDLLNMSVGSNARFFDGFQVDPDSFVRQGESGHRINSHLNFGLTPTDTSEYRVGYERYDQKGTTVIPFYKPGQPIRGVDKTDDVVRERYTGRGAWQWDSGEVILRGYQENFLNTSIPDGINHRRADLDSWKIGTQVNQDAGDWNILTFGMDYFEESLNQTLNGVNELDSANPSRNTFEMYLQDEMSIGKLTLLPGARWQYDSDFGSHAVPAINGRYDFIDDGDLRFFMRGGVGQGYRVSNLKERYFVFDHRQLGYIIKGNPDLKPEESVSYQLGFVVADISNFSIDLNFFLNDLTDLIETAVVGFNSDDLLPHTVYSYVNVDKARTQGVELATQFQLMDTLNLQLSYNYLDAKNLTTGFGLNDRPQNQITAVVDYQTDFDLGLTLIGRWVSQQASYETDPETGALLNKFVTPEYTQLDLKVNQGLGDHFTLYGGIDNITDVQRDFSAGGDQRPIVGRLIYFGVQLDY